VSADGIQAPDGIVVPPPAAEPRPPGRTVTGSRLARLKRRGLRVVVWLRRHPWLVASLGFVSGVLSFVLVERHEGVARAMAVAMLAGWLLLVLERVLDRTLRRRFGFGLPPMLVRYLTQFTHQESLFFALPFFAASTSWNSGQAVFTSVLGVMALVAIVDPLYFGRLAKRRWLFLGYHTLTLFALLLVVLPLVLQVPAMASYQAALAVAVALSFPTLAGVLSVPRWWRGLLVLVLLAGLGATGWLARLWVPPATLRLAQVAVTTQVDEARKAPTREPAQHRRRAPAAGWLVRLYRDPCPARAVGAGQPRLATRRAGGRPDRAGSEWGARRGLPGVDAQAQLPGGPPRALAGAGAHCR